MIKSRVLRTGDGSHKYSKMAKDDPECAADNNNLPAKKDHDMFWGWVSYLKSTFSIRN